MYMASLENVTKKLLISWDQKWREFTKSFYECIREYEVNNFMIK